MSVETTVTSELGLRDRKKVKRRERILLEATRLFDEQGIDATTMADIANAADISPATVFNYFGNKDSIILAMISEGIAGAHETGFADPRDFSDLPFDQVIVQMFCEVAKDTLEIAPRRVWRFAEAAVIRRPNTDLAREYEDVENRLIEAIAQFLGAYDLKLTSQRTPDPMVLARILHDIWNAEFLKLIKSNGEVQRDLAESLGPTISPLCDLIFTPDFVQSPMLKAQTRES